MEGQGQRSRAPRGLRAEAAEADAKGMDLAEALEASVESAALADLRPRPPGWETWSRSRRGRWNKTQNRNQHKGPGS